MSADPRNRVKACAGCAALNEVALSARLVIGEAIQALESYDADDGHNQLVLAGLAARLREIEDEHVAAMKTRPRQKRGVK